MDWLCTSTTDNEETENKEHEKKTIRRDVCLPAGLHSCKSNNLRQSNLNRAISKGN